MLYTYVCHAWHIFVCVYIHQWSKGMSKSSWKSPAVGGKPIKKFNSPTYKHFISQTYIYLYIYVVFIQVYFSSIFNSHFFFGGVMQTNQPCNDNVISLFYFNFCFLQSHFSSHHAQCTLIVQPQFKLRKEYNSINNLTIRWAHWTKAFCTIFIYIILYDIFTVLKKTIELIYFIWLSNVTEKKTLTNTKNKNYIICPS